MTQTITANIVGVTDRAVYAVQLEEVRQHVETFKARYGSVLDNTSSQYFHLTDRLTDAEYDYVQSLHTLGESVNSLAAMVDQDEETSGKLYSSTRLAEIAAESMQYVRQQYEAKTVKLYHKSVKRQWSDAKRRSEASKLQEKYQERFRFRRAQYYEAHQKMQQLYQSTYGEAYKRVLTDLGVEFADGGYWFETLVSNPGGVSPEMQQFHCDALSCYPESWVDHVALKPSVSDYGTYEEGVIHIQPHGDSFDVELQSSCYSSTLHEWGHILELSNNRLGRAERLLLIATRDMKAQEANVEHGAAQRLATRGLVTPYSGRYYDAMEATHDINRGHTYEVLTTGVEALFTGNFGGFRMDATSGSQQHRNFLLALFVTENSV